MLGSKFVISNDQKPLSALFAKDKPVSTSCSARILRWSLILSHYNYTFEYSIGKDNINSDCLSRLPLPDTVSVCEPYEIVFPLETLDNNLITVNDVKTCTDADNNLNSLEALL